MRRAFLLGVATLSLALGACTTTGSSSSSSSSDGDSVDLLHDRGAAQRAISAMVKRVGADPAQVSLVYLYAEYSDMDAQDPRTPDHIDSYTWRDDEVDDPTPKHLSGPQEAVLASLFPTSSVRWSTIPRLAHIAEDRLLHAEPTRVEQARATSVYVERSSTLDGRVTLRFTIEGPRRSGRVEMTPSGEVLEATVD